MTSWEQIVSVMKNRQDANRPLLSAMEDVALRYNGDYVLPHITDEEWAKTMPPLTPALVTEGIDQLAMRAGSVMPSIFVPSMRDSEAAMERADRRRKAIHYSYYKSHFRLGLRRGYRHLAGFATFCMGVVPDYKTGCPRIETRNPMFAYPDLNEAEHLRPPTDIGFLYGRSATWIRERWPEARFENGGPIPGEARTGDSNMWDLVEWWDADNLVIGILGERERLQRTGSPSPGTPQRVEGMELRRYENKIGVSPWVCPSRVTLDKLASQISHVVGITDMMAKLQALDIVAAEKAIFPDMYVISEQGREAEIVSGDGNWQDGRFGIVNVLAHTQTVGTINTQPSPAGQVAIDRMERNARISAGIAPGFTGEAAGARTGRAFDTRLSAQIDPRIQEMQEVVEDWMPTLNEHVLATFEAEWGNRKYTVFSGWATDNGHIEFIPDKDFAESHANAVSYPIAGADIGQVNIHLGQALAAGGISQHTFRQRHPWIPDPDAENRKIREEQIEQLAMQKLLNQGDQITFKTLALIEEHFRKNRFGDIFTALRDASEQEEAEQQALAAQQVTAEAQALGPGAVPGQVAPSPDPLTQQPQVAPPTDSQDNLRQVLLALNSGRTRQ